MPQFEVGFFTGEIFWLFVSFGFLYLMMAGIICPILDDILGERERFIKEGLAKADQLNRQADIIHQRHQVFLTTVEQRKVDKIGVELKKMRQEAHQKEAQNELAVQRKVRQTEDKIKKAKRDLSDQMNELSDVCSEKLIRKLYGKKAGKKC